MAYVPTGPWNVIKQPQFVEETTYGVTPSSPTFIHAGPLVEMTDTLEIGSIQYRQIGSRDIHSLIKTGEMYEFEIVFNPVNETLMKYGIDLPAGTGTIEKSLTFLKSQLVNGTENFQIYRGCRCDEIEIEIENDGAVEVTMTFLCKDISTPSATHGLSGTPTFASNPGGTPWTNITPGTGPLSVNSVVVDTPSFSVTVTNNLEVIKPNGEIQAKFVEATLRDIEFEFDTWYKDGVLMGDVKTLTPRAMEYKLSTNRKLVFTDAYFETLEMADINNETESKIQTFEGIAKSVAVTSF